MIPDSHEDVNILTVSPRRTPQPWSMTTAAVALLFVSVFGFFFSSSGCTNSKPSLRLGVSLWPGYEPLFLAQRKGFFLEEGANVRLVEFASLADSRRAYERGQIDGLATTVIEVIEARSNSQQRQPQIVYAVDYSNGADKIIAVPEISSPAQLRGARIGVELESLGVYVLARALERVGLTLADVKALSMDQVSMEEQLANGELDAVVTYPPSSVRLISSGRWKSVFSTSEIPDEVLDVLVVDKRLISANRSLVASFLKGWRRALEYVTTHPVEANEIMAAREGLSATAFSHSMNDGIVTIPARDQATFLKQGGPVARAIETAGRVLLRNGQITQPYSGDDLIDSSFAELEGGTP